MPLSLTELLPDEDYRFHMTLRKGDLSAFFGAPAAKVLQERRDWISREPARFTAAQEDSRAAVAELYELAASWSGVVVQAVTEGSEPLSKVMALGGSLSADFMLLTRDGSDPFRLRAGAVCFPSSWALEEKMGRTLDAIHGYVPGLNPAIGGAIDQFLGRLKPETAFERTNWGLASTPELNLHPILNRPKLSAQSDIFSTWLRIEDQIFAALPASGAILFGIGLRIFPLSAVLGDAHLRKGFRRAIVTMPEDLADYKGVSSIRAPLVDLFSP